MCETKSKRAGMFQRNMSIWKFIEGSCCSPRWQQLLSSVYRLMRVNSSSRKREALRKEGSLRSRMRSKKRLITPWLTSKLAARLKSQKYSQYACLVVLRISSTKTIVPSKASQSSALSTSSPTTNSITRHFNVSCLQLLVLSSEVSSCPTRVLTEEQRRLTSRSSSCSGRVEKQASTGSALWRMKKPNSFCRQPRQVSFDYGRDRICNDSLTSSCRWSSPSTCQPVSSSSAMGDSSGMSSMFSSKKSSAMAVSSLHRTSVAACAAVLVNGSSSWAYEVFRARAMVSLMNEGCLREQATKVSILLSTCCAVPPTWKKDCARREGVRRRSLSGQR